MKLPLSVSPSTTANLKLPVPNFSISSLGAPLLSSSIISFANLLSITLTGCPVEVPVTTVDLSLAFKIISL